MLVFLLRGVVGHMVLFWWAGDLLVGFVYCTVCGGVLVVGDGCAGGCSLWVLNCA